MREWTVDAEIAHTISQRLRTLKKIPAELIPLGMLSTNLTSLMEANRMCAGVVLS